MNGVIYTACKVGDDTALHQTVKSVVRLGGYQYQYMNFFTALMSENGQLMTE